MATPLWQRVFVMKLPMSVTGLNNEPMYLHLGKALKWLRIASQEWVVFLSDIVRDARLVSCSLEPCLFTIGEL